MDGTVDIEVTVIGGRDFVNAHSFRPNPSYCLSLKLNEEEKRTKGGGKGIKTQKWDQKFIFAANLDSTLHIDVICIHLHIGEDHAIGEADIGILTTERNKDVEIAIYRKAKRSEEKMASGYITLHLRVALPVTFAVQGSKAGLRSRSQLNQMSKAVKIMNQIDGKKLAPAWTRLITCLDTVSSYAKKISELDSRAALAVSAVAFMVQVLVKQIERDEKVERLGVIMADLYTYIRDGIEMNKILTYQKMLDKVLTQTTECAYFIAEYRKVKLFAQRAVVNVVSNADTMIAQFEASFGELKISLILGSSLQTAIVSYRILRTVENIESLIHINNLPHLKNVGWNSGRTCLRGTRQDLIDEILEWTSSSSSIGQTPAKQIYVLAGPPGCGKTTVAHTIAQAFHEQKRLAASLFLQGLSGPAVNSQTVSSSIIHQLAGYNTDIKARISEILKSDPSLAYADIGQQFRHLLVGSINSGGTNEEPPLAVIGPTLIVLDGSHEISAEQEQNWILTAIADYFVQLPPNFRLLMTSQNGDIITGVLGRISRYCDIRQITFDTPGGESPEHVITSSLELLTAKVPEVREKYALGDLCLSLMERSMSVPTWIDTLFRFLFICVDHKESFPGTCDTLQQILSTSLPLSKEDAMDNLYPIICSSLPYPSHLVKDLLFTFTYSRKALSLNDSHKFISWACRLHDTDAAGQTNCPILHAFQELGLVIEKGSTHNGESLFVLSPAFADFLTNERRCHGTGLFVDPKELCSLVIMRIKTMNDELAPYVRKASKSESLSFSGRYPSGSLHYACLTWAFCMDLCDVGYMASPSNYSLLLSTIEEFLGENIINWTYCSAIMEEESTLDSEQVQKTSLQRLENWLMHHLSSTSISAFELRLYLLLVDTRMIISRGLTAAFSETSNSGKPNEVNITTLIVAGGQLSRQVDSTYVISDGNSFHQRLTYRNNALVTSTSKPGRFHCALLTTRLPSLCEIQKDVKIKQVNFKISISTRYSQNAKAIVPLNTVQFEALMIREFRPGLKSLAEPSRSAAVELEVDIESYIREALDEATGISRSEKVIADTVADPNGLKWQFKIHNLPPAELVFEQATWTEKDNSFVSLLAPGSRIALMVKYADYVNAFESVLLSCWVQAEIVYGV